MNSAEEQRRALNRLEAGSDYCICGRYLRSLNEINRQEIYINLESERLESKYLVMMEEYKRCGENWNQLLFVQFFAYLGANKNKATYMSLARAVGYNAILRERLNPQRVEALLLGASGLLKSYFDDHYTLTLKREAEYMMRKYNITPLSSIDWDRSSLNSVNNPVLRLAQAAQLFTKQSLFFDKVMACRCLDDVVEIFSVEASDYWTTHYVPSRVSTHKVKRIGRDKCNILGINVVVMLQFAYGVYTSNEALVDQAHNLLENLLLESNRIIIRWQAYGLHPKSAFEGQALIQLSEKYCKETRCAECYVGRRAMQNMSWLDDYERE